MPIELEYSVRQVPVERILALRKAVLRPYLEAVEEFVLDDDLLPTTVAFAAVTPADEVIGVARLTPEPPPFDEDAQGWRLRAMATRPDTRNRGVGTAVLESAIHHAAAHGGGILWCNARLAATGLYSRAGMRPWGEPWEDPRIGPHIVMWRKLTAEAA